MQCVAITKGQKRCRKTASFLFCPTHRKHPLILGLILLTFLGSVSGIFRDLVEPLLPKGSVPTSGSGEPAKEPLEIKVPLEFESTWDSDTTLSPMAEIYLIRPASQTEEELVYSAMARVEVPENGATENGEIWIQGGRTTRTTLILPRSEVLSRALTEGGSVLRVVVRNKHGHTFTHSKTMLFDSKSISIPLHFWFRLDFEQIP